MKGRRKRKDELECLENQAFSPLCLAGGKQIEFVNRSYPTADHESRRDDTTNQR